jgi:hypothetical protein
MSRKIVIKIIKNPLGGDHSYRIVKVTNPRNSDHLDIGVDMDRAAVERYIKDNRQIATIELVGE